MNNEYKKNEYNLAHVLKMIENGASEAAIFELYPEHKAELESVFSNIGSLVLGKNVRPPEEFLRSTLGKSLGKSPKKASPYWSSYRSSIRIPLGVVSLALVMIILGGTLYSQYHSGQSGQPVQSIQPGSLSQPSPQSQAVSAPSTGDSDASLDQDLNEIDGQMDGLNSDTSSIDQDLSQGSYSQQS